MKRFASILSPDIFLPRVPAAWLLALPASYLICGFLGNFHADFSSLFVIALLSQAFAALFFRRALRKAELLFASSRGGFFTALALFTGLLIFAIQMLLAAARFPAMFDTRYIFLEHPQILPFLLAVFFAFPLAQFIRDMLIKNHWTQTVIFSSMDSNLAGILIVLPFFVVYFTFSFIFNQPVFDLDDIFFDTDVWMWRMRFATDAYQDFYWRAAHPFVLIIIRPVTAALSWFLSGDRLSAAFLLPPISGALCVFFAWYFVKQKTGSTVYALLIASLLGGSAGHLIFGALLETYIFLAVLAMSAALMALKDAPLPAFIAAGLLSFGITLSNLIQPSILFALRKRNLKQWILYGVIVAALAFPLALLNNAVYPRAHPYFFDLSAYDTEGRNTFNPSLRRGMAVGRVMFAYSFVAPDPLVFPHEINFFKVWMVDVSRKVHRFDPDHMKLSEYQTTFGTALAAGWLALAAFGIFGLLKNLKQEDVWLPLSFALIVLFSFTFHLWFGKELFLYATNWIHAIVLFLALGWKDFAKRTWFQSALLVFALLMMINNARLFFVMLGASSFFIP